jgi:hypothetical protein
VAQNGGSQEAEIRAVQGIKSGQNFLVDIEVSTPSHYTVGELDAIKVAMREKIAADVKGVKRVSVRFVSNVASDTTPFADEFLASKEGDVDAQDHDHDHDHDHSHAESHTTSSQTNGSATKRK